MATGVQALVPGIVDSAQLPATARITANVRVRTQSGAIGLLTDVVSFPGPATVSGNWTLGAMRTSINGIPAITQTSVGVGISPVGVPSGPMTVRIPDSRVMAG